LAWADRGFPDRPVIYVHGNHEDYTKKSDTLKGKLAEACSAFVHIYSLGELAIDGVRFLCATLWSDFLLLGADSIQEAMQLAGSEMNGYRKIRLAKVGYRRVKP